MITMRRVGQQSIFTATFRSDKGVLINPDVVRFKWRTADEAVADADVCVFGTDSEIVRTSTGVYEFTAPKYDTSTRHLVLVESEEPITSNEDVVDVITSDWDATL